MVALPKPTQQEAAAAAEAADADEARAEEREDVQNLTDAEETAEAKRELEKAAGLKSVPEGALPPTEKTTRSGETVFTREWLIANAQNVLGHDSHVVVGALHGDDREYLSVKEATQAVDAWLNTVVTFDPNDAEEAA